MINFAAGRIPLRSLAAGAALLATTGCLVAEAAQPAAAMPVAPVATVHDIQFGVQTIKNDSAGTSYVDLTFRNISDHDVRIHGYAGVSVVAHHNGTQVGRPGTWLRNRRAVTVVLKPGAVTTEIVSIADAGDYGKGHTLRADGFRVYLPGSRAAAFVPHRFTATTRDVAQIQVDPIGARI